MYHSQGDRLAWLLLCLLNSVATEIPCWAYVPWACCSALHQSYKLSANLLKYEMANSWSTFIISPATLTPAVGPHVPVINPTFELFPSSVVTETPWSRRPMRGMLASRLSEFVLYVRRDHREDQSERAPACRATSTASKRIVAVSSHDNQRTKLPTPNKTRKSV